MQARKAVVVRIAVLVAALSSPLLGLDGGVVVERAERTGAGARAGVEPGDVLVGWRRAPRPPDQPEAVAGVFETVFDVRAADLEQGPREDVSLGLVRDGRQLTLELPPGGWALHCRPHFGGVDLEEYLLGRAAFDDGDAELGDEVWTALGTRFAGTGRLERAVELAFLRGEATLAARRFELALEAVAEGLAGARRLDRPSWRAMLKTLEARIAASRNDHAAAAASASEALEEWRSVGTPSLAEADVLGVLSAYHYNLGELERAQEHLERALDIEERLAPDSVEVASTLVGFGHLLDPPQARERLERALSIARRKIPEGLLHANILTTLANIARTEGDLARAEDLHRQTLDIRLRVAPDHFDIAYSTYGLGAVMAQRGKLAEAEAMLRDALDVVSRRRPGSRFHADTLLSLGVVNGWRGDSQAALDYYRRAYEINERLRPQSESLAALHINIGSELRTQGDLAEAQRHYLTAWEMRRELGLENVDDAMLLDLLAKVALEEGDLDEAEARADEALRWTRRLAPSSLAEASVLESLSRLAAARGERSLSIDYSMQALDIVERVAPASAGTAEILGRLAELHREAGRNDEAIAFSARALSALESQMSNLGGGQEVRASFAARFGPLYRSHVGMLVEADRPAEAFHVSERFRARLLRAMLAERDLVLAADLPADLDRDRRMLNVHYDRLYAELTAASAVRDADALTRMQAKLDELRLRRRDIEARVRSASLRPGAVGASEPLDLAASRRVLGEGALLLSYVIGERGSYLFAVGPGSEDFRVAALDLDPEQLRADAELFHRMLARGPTRLRNRLDAVAGRLSAALLEPVRELLSRADRVVVLADGPLHVLPFGALPTPVEGSRRRLLVEALPLSFAPSATVLAELASRRPHRQIERLAAFGDPRYPAVEAATSSSPALSQMVERGLDLRPLPASRIEIESLQGLFGEQASVWLGREATEEQVKALGREVDVVHFACHAFVDEQSPLDSGLVLTVPDDASGSDENGVLQAWEIFERVRLDAELVTLSACETALGKESGGEGILGLTRAFQFAGARTVVASMWGVSDLSTAALMSRFYGYLKQGMAKAEALRRAQLDLMNGSIELETGGTRTVVDATHPYHWAAFQLYGDWR